MRWEEVQEINWSIQSISEGNDQAIETLFALMFTRMYSVAFKYLRQAEDAEDIVTEIFCDIKTVARQYIGGMNGYNYLCVITRNRAYDLLKARKRHKPTLPDVLPVDEVAERAEKVQADMQIAEALKALDKDEYAAVFAVYWYGMTVREAAKANGVPKSTFQRTLNRAREKVRKGLE